MAYASIAKPRPPLGNLLRQPGKSLRKETFFAGRQSKPNAECSSALALALKRYNDKTNSIMAAYLGPI